MSSSPSTTVRLATRAMATRFELVLLGPDERHLRAAGEEAIREIQRISDRFNFFDPGSELSHINRAAGHGSVRVAGDLFELLQICTQINERTCGAFDPSIAALMRAWGQTSVPEAASIRQALQQTGWDHVILDEGSRTIRFDLPGVQIDLGGVAKGWALDEAARLLLEQGIENALLHGGTSSVTGLGNPDVGEPWRVGIEDPYESGSDASWFAHCDLSNTSLSVSAIHGKSFVHNDIEYGHVLDPRTGQAISGPVVSAVEASSATEADGWSTAMIVLSDAQNAALPSTVHRAASFIKKSGSWLVRSGSWV